MMYVSLEVVPELDQLSSNCQKLVIKCLKKVLIETEDFSKDNDTTRRDAYTPRLADECHVIEKKMTAADGRKNLLPKVEKVCGINCVGVLPIMSAYFHRLKPKDFKLLTEYGEIEGANMVIGQYLTTN